MKKLTLISLAVAFGSPVKARAQAEVEPCDSYSTVVDESGIPLNTNRARVTEGCEGTFDRDMQGAYKVSQRYWDEGWGWDANAGGPPEDERGYCRLMTGIRMLEQSGDGLPGDDLLATAPNFTRQQTPRLQPSCSVSVNGKSDTAAFSNGMLAFLSGFATAFLDQYIEISVIALFRNSPIDRAKTLYHEASHFVGGGNPHQSNDCLYTRVYGGGTGVGALWPLGHYVCDHSVNSGGSYGYAHAFLRRFAQEAPSAAGAGRPRVTLDDLSAAVSTANFELAWRFREEPGYRLDDPTFTTFVDVLPGVTQEVATVGCNSEACTWDSETSADPNIDSCGLSKFGGDFETLDDQLRISISSTATLSTRSRHLAVGDDPSGSYGHVPLGAMLCRSGGNPSFHGLTVAPPVGGATPTHERDESLHESASARACYLRSLAGDLNNGDEAHVYIGADGMWHAHLYSNFSNGYGLNVGIACSDASNVKEIGVGANQSIVLNKFAPDVCLITKVRNDFAGLDEKVIVERLSDSDSWTLTVTSNRPGDAGGQVEGTVVCFSPE